MANSRDLKNRIKSVKNTQKITRTMELVATAKAKVATNRIERAIPYFEALTEIATQARGAGGAEMNVSHPLLEDKNREIKSVLLLVIVANRGLCGGYNSSVLRLARDRRRELQAEGKTVHLIPSGGKAFTWLRYQGIDFEKGYRQFEDKPEFAETEEVTSRLMKRFLSTGEDRVDRVEVIYTHFVSAGRQEARFATLLPLAAPNQEESASKEQESQPESQDSTWIIEPDPQAILGAIFPLKVKLELFRCYLSAAASEQIARRVAMKNATENSRDLGRNLRMQYNRMRQAQITTEILEIMGGAEALK